MVAPPIESDDELQRLYEWIDGVQLSRPKRNISRDFSDGVLFAECVKHFFPSTVDLHCISSANNQKDKLYNWKFLNEKVLKKLSYTVHQTDIDEVTKSSPGAIERVLKVLRDKVILNQRGQLKVQRSSGVPHIEGRAPLHMEAPATLIQRSRNVVASKDPEPSRTPGREGMIQGLLNGPAAGTPPSKPAREKIQRAEVEVENELLLEKEQTIEELREMIVIMSEKIKKLDQLVKIKDQKIETMQQKLQKNGIR